MNFSTTPHLPHVSKSSAVAASASVAIADLAWTGQHALAIERCTQALGGKGLTPAQRMALLDLRAESLIAQGRFADAALNAAAMLALADKHEQAALKVRALIRQTMVSMRQGAAQAALQSAAQAVALAQGERGQILLAQSLLGQAEAQLRGALPEAALASAKRVAAMFEAAGDIVGTGRAHWVEAFAQTRLSDNQASRAAAQRAVALARQAGDEQGLANALNVLSFSSKDIAERMALLTQAAQAFERSGYAFGRMMVVGNLSIAFAELGLWRHACRLGEQVRGRRPLRRRAR